MTVSRRTLLLATTVPAFAPRRETGKVAAASTAALDETAGTHTTPASLAYRGVNLSGAEFTADASHLPGVVDRDYRYPTRADLRYVAGRGHRMVRLPIRWERIQPALMSPLQPAELERIRLTIDSTAAVGLKVLVDLHNYARYIQPATRGGATLVMSGGQLADAQSQYGHQGQLRGKVTSREQAFLSTRCGTWSKVSD